MEGITTIKSNNSEVLSTGTFITFKDEESSIHLEHKGESITVYLKFVDEEGKDFTKDRKQTFDVIDENSARFTMINFTNELGVFSLEPLLLGSIGNRELYFQYKVDHLHKALSKLVYYTFHLGKEVKNGQD